VRLTVNRMNRLPDNTARVAAGHPATAALGAMFGTINVSVHDGLAANHTTGRTKSARLRMATDLDSGQDHADRYPSNGGCGLPDAGGTQSHRLDANPYRPESRGYFGLLQPLADGIQAAMKEIIVPRVRTNFLFVLAPIMALMPALAAWAVVPFQRRDGLVQCQCGSAVHLAITRWGVYGVIIAGWHRIQICVSRLATCGSTDCFPMKSRWAFALVCVLMASQKSEFWAIIGARQQGQRRTVEVVHCAAVPDVPCISDFGCG